MKVYIPYYHEYDDETCNCGQYDDACCEVMGQFDQRMEEISKPVFKVARNTREEAVLDLGRHIITEEKFREFYFLLIDTRDKNSLRGLGEKLHLDNFMERCQQIDKDDMEGLKKEFGPDLIQQVREKIIPEQRIEFPVEKFQKKYQPDKYMYRGDNYLRHINETHDGVRLEDIENYIDVNAGELFYPLLLNYPVFKREFVGKCEGWEDKLNSVNSYEKFRDKFYYQVIQDYDFFEHWVNEYTYYGIQEYEIF